MLEAFVAEFNRSSIPELIAVILAVAYLVLAVRESIACWYAAFASTLIFLVIFFDVRLYMESALQVYYLGMAVYGWYQWQRGSDEGQSLGISVWSWRQHAAAIGLVLIATLLTAFLLDRYTDARLPLPDSFTTWGAVVATFMVTRKILENWIYWLIIDSVSIFLYIDRSLYFTALLFGMYIVIIFIGWATWLKHYRDQQALSMQ